MLGSVGVAVFPVGDPKESTSAGTRALRAAFGVQKMIRAAFQAMSCAAEEGRPAPPSATISLHIGPVQLIHLEDPLHGGAGFLTPAGPALDAVKSLNQNARACGWKISAHSDFMREVPELAIAGRQVHIAPSAKTPANNSQAHAPPTKAACGGQRNSRRPAGPSTRPIHATGCMALGGSPNAASQAQASSTAAAIVNMLLSLRCRAAPAHRP